MSKTTIRKGKQDDKYSLAVRDVQNSHPDNKRCFDCEQRGPTYVNMTIGSFVCTKCSGMLRGINPPHRIKSISMSTFTPDEVEFLRGHGNAWCLRVWLGTYDKQANPIDYRDDEKIRDFIIAKYERKRYYVEASESGLRPAAQSSPSVSSLSSTSSQEHKPPLTNLIGSTLKASLGVSSPPSSAPVSRPTPGMTAQPGSVPVSRPASRPLPTTTSVRPQQDVAKTSQEVMGGAASTGGGFEDFANFDDVAFDSLPADPLATPAPILTLPPIRKASQPSVVPSDIKPPEPAMKQSTASEDRYSALKELDELFKSSSISSGPSESGSGLLSSDLNLFSGGAARPASVPAGPSNAQQLGDAMQLNGGGVGGSIFGASPTPTGNLGWQWGSGNGSNATAANQAWSTPSSQNWRGLQTNSTNPFGTSPSAPANTALFPENNNDAFAATAKPVMSDKGLGDLSGNPWSQVPAFTSNMKPAHNPYNPFL